MHSYDLSIRARITKHVEDLVHELANQPMKQFGVLVSQEMNELINQLFKAITTLYEA